MSKERREIKYVAIDEIMSEKLINKIIKAFDRRTNKNDTYNEFEKILDGSDLKPFRCGTNRYVFTHKRYKRHVVKIAADTHGIRANRREFYNSSIHERLTQSLSISEDGHILVQEKVEPITQWSTFEKYWKKIDKLLWELHECFLVVDLSMTSKSMGNFGIRELKNGDKEIVACDHGDIVPFDDYQIKTVDFDEESTVSLRCRNTPNHDGKECKGHLEPHGNWEFLKCDRCKKIIKFHEAYRDIIGDIMNGQIKEKASYKSMDDDVIEEFKRLQDERDKLFIKNNIANKHVDEKREDITMLSYQDLDVFNGYVLPKPTNPYAEIIYANVLNGISTVAEYFDVIDEDMEKYKVQPIVRPSTQSNRLTYEDTSAYEESDDDEEEDVQDVTYDEASPNAEDIADSDYEEVDEDGNDTDEYDDDDDNVVVGFRDHSKSERQISFDTDDDDDGDEELDVYRITDFPLRSILTSDDLDNDDLQELHNYFNTASALIGELDSREFSEHFNEYDVVAHLIDDALPETNDPLVVEQVVLFYKMVAMIDTMEYRGELKCVSSTDMLYFVKHVRPVYYQYLRMIIDKVHEVLPQDLVLVRVNSVQICNTLSAYAYDALNSMYLTLTESGSRTAYILTSIMFEFPKEMRDMFGDLIMDEIVHKHLSNLRGKLIAVSFEHEGKIKSVTIDLYVHIKQLIKHGIITENDDAYIIDVCGLEVWNKNADDINYDEVYTTMYSQE